MPTCKSSLTILMLIVSSGSALSLVGDDVPNPAQSAGVAEAKKHLEGFSTVSVGDGRDSTAMLLDQPLLLFGDAARNNEGGSVWAWGQKGRPVAILELYRNTGPKEPWCHAITLASRHPVRLNAPAGKVWTPQQSHLELKAVPDAGAVSGSPAIRLRTMKSISRRFEAHEFWDPNNSRFELRLLVQPIHRYADQDGKLLDGALFALAHGTNPEVLLFVEANGDQPADAVWKYALVRLGSAELHVLLDGREVWKRERTPGVVGQATDPYWCFFVTRAVGAGR